MRTNLFRSNQNDVHVYKYYISHMHIHVQHIDTHMDDTDTEYTQDPQTQIHTHTSRISASDAGKKVMKTM